MWVQIARSWSNAACCGAACMNRNCNRTERRMGTERERGGGMSVGELLRKRIYRAWKRRVLLKVLTIERPSLDAIVPAGAVVPLLFELCRAACARLSESAARRRTADTRRATEDCESDERVCSVCDYDRGRGDGVGDVVCGLVRVGAKSTNRPRSGLIYTHTSSLWVYDGRCARRTGPLPATATARATSTPVSPNGGKKNTNFIRPVCSARFVSISPSSKRKGKHV